MIESILGKFKPEPQEITLKFGPISVLVDAQDYPHIWQEVYMVQDTDLNLRLAKENSIEPISLRGIFSQIKLDEIGKSVLFDSPPVAGFAGNHWRVVGINRKEEYATLQLCGEFGIYDYDFMPPVEVPFDTPLFTGISIQQFELGELPATLFEATTAAKETLKSSSKYPENLKHLGEKILWSNPKGVLVTRDYLPSSVKKMEKVTPEYRIQTHTRGNKDFPVLFINEDVPFGRRMEITAQFFKIPKDKILDILTDVGNFLQGEYEFSESDFKNRWERSPNNIFSGRLKKLGMPQTRASGLVAEVALEMANSKDERKTEGWEKEYWSLLKKLGAVVENPGHHRP